MITFSCAGIQTYNKSSEEVATCRPSGAVQLVAEPDNKYDSKAIKIMWQGIHLGYVKRGWVQTKLHEDGITVGRVVDYSYCPSGTEDWNREHRGILSSVTIGVDADEPESKIIGGRYLRVTKLLDMFNWAGEAIMRWAFNQGDTYEEYAKELDKLAKDGDVMHDAIECYFKHGGFDESRVNLPAGWKNFTDKFNPEAIDIEERFYDNELMVTGKPDFFGYINCPKTKRRVLAVLDWKSSKSVKPKHRAQVSIYAKNCEYNNDKPECAYVIAFGADTKKGYSEGYVDRDMIEELYGFAQKLRQCYDTVSSWVRTSEGDYA